MSSSDFNRRDFIKISTAATAGIASGTFGAPLRRDDAIRHVVVDDFRRPDSFYHGDGWESMNPGFWMIRGNALRRRLTHRGDQRPVDWFPWHWETHMDRPMPVDYDPSLPLGMMYRRDWKLSGDYTIRIEATVHDLPPTGDDLPEWKRHTPGYALMGICFGSQCQHESWEPLTWLPDRTPAPYVGGWMAAWRDDGRFGLYQHSDEAAAPIDADAERSGLPLNPGDRITIELSVEADGPERALVTASLDTGTADVSVSLGDVDREAFTNGYFGLVSRGLLDFEVERISLMPVDNEPLEAPTNELHVCYALGDTLEQVDGQWRCRFVALFRNLGEHAEIRLSDREDPEGGWAQVPVAGQATIITNEFRRQTAVIEAALPQNPAEATLYYTVWKDGRDVTADPRPRTDAVGAGTGFVDPRQHDGRYVGRLPRLVPPYRLCGLSCHAIHRNNPNLPDDGIFEAWYVHDQPSLDAFEHLDAYDFQVMLWEDDVWYLELLFRPPSVDDAYKVITTTIAGPTGRWQMMRHWNVINPGDHDYGMDDVKGPEQIIIRNVEGLGQDPEYMRRNFQIVQHLCMADENPSPTDNPKRWRRWKMPEGDFSLLILDGRLWRSSQDTNIWDDEGWGHKQSLYSRRDPTRSLLGEEQFAWLQQVIRTDSSPLIALTGINGLHTIWTGRIEDPETKELFAERGRIAADYAGWVTAGSDRVLDLLGSRPGVVTVYGDVHNGCIMKNRRNQVYECSFGPISRYGGRPVKPGFGPVMTDYDDRELDIMALYHREYESPTLEPQSGPPYWNFLEMHFDPRDEDPLIAFKLRNLIDAPTVHPRGGGQVEARASSTGRPRKSSLPPIKLLPSANVLVTTLDGSPILGTRTLTDGAVRLRGLIDVAPGTQVVVSSQNGAEAEAQIVTTSGLR